MRRVVERLKVLRERNQGLINEIETALTAKLEETKVPAIVAGREKKPYAIWSKMERKQISLEQLSDIYAFRIVVPEEKDCYRALGVVHTTWHAVPGRFKDYISNPKQNDYQSIHTTIVGPRHQRVELQIRTERMHSIAEYGVAAHALYKDSLNGSGPANGIVPSQDTNAYRWLRHLVGMLLDGDNPEEFLEHTKLELFQDQVFCFTPKGRLIALPARREPHRLRLCGPYRHRQHLRRRQDQRAADAAHDRAQERRRGRDRLLQGAAPAVGLAEPRRHRQGALGHQTRDPRRRARPIRQARPRDPGARLPAPRQSLQRGKPRPGAWAAVAEDRR